MDSILELIKKEYDDFEEVHYIKLFSRQGKDSLIVSNNNEELYKKACELIIGKTYKVLVDKYSYIYDFEEIVDKTEPEKLARGIIGYEEMWNRAVGLERINTIKNIIDIYSTQDEKDALFLALAKEILPFFEKDFPGNNKLRDAIKAVEEEAQNGNV